MGTRANRRVSSDRRALASHQSGFRLDGQYQWIASITAGPAKLPRRRKSKMGHTLPRRSSLAEVRYPA
jgi:hypothetical protein